MAGYYGRRTDRVISAGTDVLLAFPALVLTLALVGVLGERPWFADKRAWLVIASLAILSIAAAHPHRAGQHAGVLAA